MQTLLQRIIKRGQLSLFDGTTWQPSPHSLLILIAFLVLASPALPFFNNTLPVYDERRLLLVIVICLCTWLSLWQNPAKIDKSFLIPFSLVSLLGLVSTTLMSSSPTYAGLDLALFITLSSACLLLGKNQLNEITIRCFLLPMLAGSVIFYGIVTLMVWTVGWIAEGHQPPWPEPLHNFINRRFMNDWQTWLLPLLPAVLFAQVARCRPALHRSLSITYFALLWALLLFSVGRATLYAQLGCICLIPLLFGRHGLRWSAIQIAAAFLGLILLIFAFDMNPFIASGDPTDRFASLNSSGRLTLWSISLELIRENPWLGIGPMQFAALPQTRFAHPHNFVLQFMVEWGVPAALLLFGSLAWAAWRWVKFARERIIDLSCPRWEVFLLISLTGSMAAAAANSLLAGTAHTPMSQIMLILVVGCSYALYRQHYPANPFKWQRLSKAWLAATLVAGVWLGGFTTYELIHYVDNNLEGTDYVGGGWSPRFWRTGKLIVPTE